MRSFILLAIAAIVASCSPKAAPPSDSLSPAPSASAPPSPIVDTTAPLIGAVEYLSGGDVGERGLFVRVIFRKADGHWQPALPSCSDRGCFNAVLHALPRTVDWVVTRHGTPIGSATSATPDAFTSHFQFGRLRLPDDSVTLTKEHLGPLSGAEIVVAVANAKPLAAAEWKVAALKPEARASLIRAFRTKFPSMGGCTEDDDQTPRPYADKEIEIGAPWYGPEGWAIADIGLKADHCDMDPSESEYSDYTYAIAPDGRALLIGEALWFVDVGDYDGDRAAELIFVRPDDDRPAYVLVGADMRVLAEARVVTH